MRFVKLNQYFENWADAYEVTADVWNGNDSEYCHYPATVTVLATLILIPSMLFMCTLGLRPGGDDDES